MSIEKIYTALESQDGGNDLVSFLKSHIKGINDESAGRRVDNKEMQEQMKAQQDAIKAMQLQQTEFMQTLKPVVGGDGDVTKLDSNVANRLMKEIDTLKKESEDSKVNAQKAQDAKNSLQIESELAKLLDKANVVDGARGITSEVLARKLIIAEDGVIQTEDGTKANDFVTSYLSDKNDLIKPSVNVARGSTPISDGSAEANLSIEEQFLAKFNRARDSV